MILNNIFVWNQYVPDLIDFTWNKYNFICENDSIIEKIFNV